MVVHLYSKFQLGNWCIFLLSQCPCLYSIEVYSGRTKNSGYLVSNIFDWTFYTVTSWHIHETHFILMCKEIFFLFDCWPKKKKFITVEQPPSSLKRLILFFCRKKKSTFFITLLHKKRASKFGFFSFNEERVLVQGKKKKVSIQN